MKKKIVFIGVPVLLAAVIVFVLLYVFVYSIREVEILSDEDGDGKYVVIRYGEDIQEQLYTRVTADNEIASRELLYSSDRPDLAEVSADGILTVKSPGEAVITVKSKANPRVKAELSITIIQKALGMGIAMPEKLPVNEYYYLLHTGDTPSMVPLPEPANALVENLVFESTNPDIVTVTAEGVIQAHKAGMSGICVYWTGPYTEPGQKEELGRFIVNVCRETDHDKLSDHEIQWYEESCLIAHALGNIEDKIYTNTREALEESIAEGYKNLEVDLGMTSDGEVVCRHTWYSDDFGVSYDGEIPDLATFEREKYFGNLTPLTGRELLEIWAEHPELYFVTDVKQDENTNLSEVLERFVELAKETGHEKLLDHLIVQIYAIEDYDKVEEIYPVKHYLFTLYQLLNTPGKEEEAAAFTAEKDMGVLTVPASCLGTDYFVELADRHGLLLFTHILNDGSEVWRLSKRGIYGYYSDFIVPNDPYGKGEN